MAMEVIEAISDFVGDISEGIKDVAVDIGEFSKNAMENIGDQGMEALEKGDIQGAIECSDIPDENKEVASKIVDCIGINSETIKNGVKTLGGAVGVAAALSIPGFQAWSLAAGKALFDGVAGLASNIRSKNADALASA